MHPQTLKNQVLIALLCIFAGPLLALMTPMTSHAQPLNEITAATGTFAIENATIVQRPGRVLNNATIVVRDGLIEAVGQNVSIPSDADRIDGDSLTIYAGFIDGLSHTGIPEPPRVSNQSEEDTRNKVSKANPPNDRAGIQPQRDAFGLLKADHKSIADLRKVGFTAAHVVPHGRMLPGKGAIILLAGDSKEDMVLQRGVSMFAQLTGASGVYPSTPMGVMAKMRQLYKESTRRKKQEALYASNASGMPRPEFDEAHHALFPVIDGDLPILMHTTSPLDIYRALRLQESLQYPLMLSGLYGAFESVDLLLDADLPMFLTLKLPKEEEKKKGKDGDKEESEEEMVEVMNPYDPSLHVTDHTATETERINLEARRKIFQDEYIATAASLYDAGLNFGFSTKDVKPADIHGNLQKMIAKGLTEDVALASLTTIPADLLGLSRSMGSVEQGKMANLVVTKGPLFDASSKIKYVFVEGEKFEYDDDKKD